MSTQADRDREASGGAPAGRAACVDVSAAIIESGGRFLVAQRRSDQTFPLHWEFPGGKREAGESWEACLARELREELGIEARVGALVDAGTHEYPDLTVSLRFFRCAVLDGEPRPLGCRAVRWAAAADLASLRFPDADAALVTWLAARRGDAERARSPRAPRSDVARVLFSPAARCADVPAGTLLDEAASRAGVGFADGCRFGICGACAVTVRAGAGNLSPATREERAALRALGARPGARLACAARVVGDVVVEPLAAPAAASERPTNPAPR